MSSLTNVDLPDPEGAEMMKTVVIPASFKVERLLSYFFDRGLGGQRQIRDFQSRFARSAGLRKDGVGLAIQLLQQKVDLLAHLSARIEQRRQLRGVNLQARQLFADIAAV